MGNCLGGSTAKVSAKNSKNSIPQLVSPPGTAKFTSKDVASPSTATSRSESSTTTWTISSTSSTAPALGESQIIPSSSLKAYTYYELRSATRNFRPDCLLGEGGFGSVYKGWIDEQGMLATKAGTGKAVAVKRLNRDSLQGHKEWLTEVNYLGQLHHPNLVNLMGYCIEDDHRLLVYEYMSKGSLENHLFRRGSYYQPLSWAVRIKIAVGAARGLAFLHSAENPVIFRDFKTSNILLDAQYNAKLSDFGLAKDGPIGDKTHVSTRVMGTYGYAAPEYVATGHLTTKSDVYSFGVVLLEILSGRRALDKNRPFGEQNLVEWAKPFMTDKNKIYRIIDTRLEGQYLIKSAQKAAIIAFHCICTEAKYRPDIHEVLNVLEGLSPTKDSIRISQNEKFGKNHSMADADRRAGNEAKTVRHFSARYT